MNKCMYYIYVHIYVITKKVQKVNKLSTFLKESHRHPSLDIGRENIPQLHCTRINTIEKVICIKTRTNEHCVDSRTIERVEVNFSSYFFIQKCKITFFNVPWFMSISCLFVS